MQESNSFKSESYRKSLKSYESGVTCFVVVFNLRISIKRVNSKGELLVYLNALPELKYFTAFMSYYSFIDLGGNKWQSV